MLNLQYDYEELGHGFMLYFKNEENILLEFFFKNNGVLNAVWIDGNEIERGDNASYGLRVMADSKLVTLAQLCDVVENDAFDVLKELEIEAQAEREHCRAMSSPYLTGRI